MTRSVRAALWAGVASAAAVLALRPLVVTSGWLVDALGTVLAVMGVGLVVRGLTRRGGLAVLAQVVVLLVVLLALFGGSTTLIGIVPTPATFHRLVQLFSDGVQVVQRYSVPAVDLRGLRLLLVAGAGVLALAVDLLAVTLRRPALAGVPLAIVLGVPLAIAPGGSGAVAFVLTAAPFLVLLTLGRRDARWPSVAPSSATEVPPAPTLPGRASRRGASGMTAGATAVVALVAALALPAAVPGLDERALTIDTGQGDTIAVINPILNLKASLGARSDATIITYQTDQDSPAPLRIVTADIFDGQTWAPSTGGDIPRSQRVQTGLPRPPGLSDAVRAESTTQHTTSVSVQGLDQTYLPLPYPAERVDIQGDWLFEAETLNVVGDGETTRNRRYTVSHLEVDPTEEQLRAAGQTPQEIQSQYTELPDSLPQSVRDAAVEVTSGATDAYEQAADLQRYFRSDGNFTYSTTAPNDGGSDAVATFLQDKTGFCVQFASAMAVMARSLNIPARVAIGFLPGQETSGGRWRISAQDAHAWPELYFEDVGWVRFEPTPAIRTGQSPGYTTPSTPVTTTPTSPTSVPVTPTTSAAVPSATSTTTNPTPADGAGASRRTGWDRLLALPWGWILGALLLVVVLLGPTVSAAVLRRRRWASVADAPSSAEAAWTEVEDRVRDLGVGWPLSATPRSRVASLREAVGEAGAARDDLDTMLRDVESARFGAGSRGTGAAHSASRTAVLQRPLTGRQSGRVVRAQVDTVVDAVAATRPRWVRWRAKLLPLTGVRAMLEWWDRG
ncbi:MAG: transglutaminaseTgpA domain-containing protein [Janthinobacterium lividum]